MNKDKIDNQELLINRWLLATATFIIPSLGFLLLWLDSSVVEPMIDRYVIAIICLTLLVATYFSKLITKNLHHAMHGLYYLVSLDVLFSLYINQFKMEYFVEVLALLLVITALGFRKKSHLWTYLLFINASLLVILTNTDETSFNKEFTFFTLAIISAVVAFTSGLKMDAQNEMKESEASWRSIFQDAGDHIVVVNEQRQIRFINYASHGQSPEDFVGQDILNLIPKHEKMKVQEKFDLAMTSEKVTYGTDFQLPNGEVMHFLTTASPLFTNGKVNGVVFMARDITEQKATQKRLEEQNRELTRLHLDLAEGRERIKRFLEGLPIGVYAIDKAGNSFYANDKAVEILGKGVALNIRDKNLAQNHQTYLSGTTEHYPVAEMPIIKALHGESVTIDNMEIERGEERVPLEVTGRPIYNSEGEIEYALAIFSDISERKKSLKILSDFTSALDSSACIVRTDKNGIITYANEYFCKLSGYHPDELIGQTHEIVNSGYHKKSFFKNMWNTILSGQVWKGEVKNKAKNGKYFWQIKSIVPILGANEEVSEFVSVSANVTKHRELESQLRKAKEEAEQAAKAKSSFLATMSHEIRTPLNAVIGMTGLLNETNLDDEQQDYVQTVKLGGENLLNVINDILDFSKMESGRLQLEDHEFNLAESIEDVLDLVAANAVKKDIELMYEIQPDVPRLIKCDSTRLRQVLTNLLANAIKFTSNKGEVIVSTENEEEISDYMILKFAIKDSGIGIPEEKLNMLFKPFSQVDASMTRKYGGTGLGLSICKKLVNFMGGDIWVDSKVGSGSTFYFTIRVKAVSSQHKEVAISDLSGVSALVVDDNDTNLKILTRQCEGFGMDVTATNNPETALQYVKASQAFDIVIVDMQMPQMDGIELTKSIRKYFSIQELPIIMLSSLGTLIEPQDKKLLSCCISKPVKQTQLNTIIYNQLQNNKEEAMDNTKAIEEHTTNKLKILLTEDNPINQKVAIRMLEKLGHTCDIAGNGFEAIDALSFKDYDLIFMDVQMPEMDGLEATRRIKNYKNGSAPLIIGMTAHALDSDRQKCLKAGMDDYITKPVQIQKIQDLLDKWFPTKAVSKAS